MISKTIGFNMGYTTFSDTPNSIQKPMALLKRLLLHETSMAKVPLYNGITRDLFPGVLEAPAVPVLTVSLFNGSCFEFGNKTSFREVHWIFQLSDQANIFLGMAQNCKKIQRTRKNG